MGVLVRCQWAGDGWRRGAQFTELRECKRLALPRPSEDLRLCDPTAAQDQPPEKPTSQEEDEFETFLVA
jgi:hypothetical protein